MNCRYLESSIFLLPSCQKFYWPLIIILLLWICISGSPFNLLLIDSIQLSNTSSFPPSHGTSVPVQIAQTWESQFFLIYEISPEPVSLFYHLISLFQYYHLSLPLFSPRILFCIIFYTSLPLPLSIFYLFLRRISPDSLSFPFSPYLSVFDG